MRIDSKYSKLYPFLSYKNKIKLKIIEDLGGKCIKCGYDNKLCLGAWHFHHRDPSTKKFNISMYADSRSQADIEEEVKKCDLLCCRCHAETHNEIFLKQKKETKLNRKKDLSEKLCKNCSKTFESNKNSPYGKFCSFDCYQKSKTKFGKPSKDELAKLMESKSLIAIGRQYGVSDNAVRRWAKKFNLIQERPKGYLSRIKYTEQ